MTESGPDRRRACAEMRLLIQADLDGELDAAATAVLSAHVADCPGCLDEQGELIRLSAALHDAALRRRAPDALRRSIEASLAPRRAAPAVTGGFRRLRPLLSFGAGAAMAAAVAIIVLPELHDHGSDRGRDSVIDQGIEAQLVAAHIRALQPGHLTDVLSTDQHTVKPWFNGRLDFSPPVYDFAAQGFPLLGGRLDYVGGRSVAVLVYGHAKHLIDVFVWPGTAQRAAAPEARHGYNVVSWSDQGMRCAAVSDVARPALARLVELWTGHP